MPAKTGITQKVGAAKAASVLAWGTGNRMRLQLTLEMLLSMLISLLVVFFLLQSFVNEHALLAKTEYALSRIAGSVGLYQSRLFR